MTFHFLVVLFFLRNFYYDLFDLVSYFVIALFAFELIALHFVIPHVHLKIRYNRLLNFQFDHLNVLHHIANYFPILLFALLIVQFLYRFLFFSLFRYFFHFSILLFLLFTLFVLFLYLIYFTCIFF